MNGKRTSIKQSAPWLRHSPLANHVVYFPQRQCQVEKESIYYAGKEDFTATNYKKEEFEENSVYSFKKIRNTEYKNSIGVSESKFLTDATIPFQIKPWGYDETKNSDEKVSVGAFCVLKKLHLGGGGKLLTYMRLITELDHPKLQCIF